jgi:hypothetical protein
MSYVTNHPPALIKLKSMINSGAELSNCGTSKGSAWVRIGNASVPNHHFRAKSHGVFWSPGNVDGWNCGEVLMFDFIAFGRSGTGINQHSGQVSGKTDLGIDGAWRVNVIRRDGHVPMAKMSRSQSGH